jgi:NADH:ubiquinone oxidoreductase subunit 5 (subunit L)/multisubunit Na+/H+ antiporter MnhA subunit
MPALPTWLRSPLLPALILGIGAVLIWCVRRLLPPRWLKVALIFRVFSAIPVLVPLVAAWSLRQPVSPSRSLLIFPPALGLDLSLKVQLDDWGGLFGLSLLWPSLVMAGLGLLGMLFGDEEAADVPAWSRWLLLLAAAHVVLAAADWLTLSAALILFDLVYLITVASSSESRWGFLVNSLGGLAVLAAAFLLSLSGHSLTLQADESLPSLAALLITLAALIRTAPYPLHFWVPASSETPLPAWRWPMRFSSPVVGLYLLTRTPPLLIGAAPVGHVVLIAGIVGCLAAALLAWLGAQREPARAMPFIGLYHISLALLTWTILGDPLVELWASNLIILGVTALAVHRTWVDGRKNKPLVWWSAVPGGVAAAALAGLPLTVGLFVRQPLSRVLLDNRQVGWLALFLVAESALVATLLRVWDGLHSDTFGRQGIKGRPPWSALGTTALLAMPLLLLRLFPSLPARLAGFPAAAGRFSALPKLSQLARGGLGLWAALLLPMAMGYGIYRSEVSWPVELADVEAQLTSILNLDWLHRFIAQLLNQARQALWSVGAVMHGEGYLAWMAFSLLLISLLVLRLG